MGQLPKRKRRNDYEVVLPDRGFIRAASPAHQTPLHFIRTWPFMSFITLRKIFLFLIAFSITLSNDKAYAQKSTLERNSNTSSLSVPVDSAGFRQPAAAIDYNYIIDAMSQYIDSTATSSGAIIMNAYTYTLQGKQYWKIDPYEGNYDALALLDDPTQSNLTIVKNWMAWILHHLNPDGSIYDYYTNVDSVNGGTEYSAGDFDSQDSYAATFLTLAVKYIQVVPSDSTWLKGYSKQLESIGNAIQAVTADASHPFGPDLYDGLTVAKLNYHAKYTMDNSEVNEGLRNMIWLEQNVCTYHNVSFYQTLLDNNTSGFANLWDANESMYLDAEGDTGLTWNTFYPYAVCNLYPIWCGVIMPSSSRASALWDAFNSHYSSWQNGTRYADYPWTIVCYAAAVMNDSSKVNTYLTYIQNLLKEGSYPSLWYNTEAAFTLMAAHRVMNPVVDVKGDIQPLELENFGLSNNYPNPFNPSTTIKVSLRSSGNMSLKIYNVLGQLVKVVDQGYKQAGEYSYEIDMKNYPSGVYFYSLQQGLNAMTKKFVLEK